MSNSEHVFFWATVESLQPFTVRRDGETSPMGVSPSSLVNLGNSTSSVDLAVGDRVWCQLQHRRALVLGRAGGMPRNGSFYAAMPGMPGMMFAANRSNNQGPGLWFAQEGNASGSDAALWLTKKSSSEFAAADILNIRGPSSGSGIRFRNGPYHFWTHHVQVDNNLTVDGHFVVNSNRVYFRDLPSSSAGQTLGRSTNWDYIIVLSSVRSIKVNAREVDDDIPERILDLKPKLWYDRLELQDALGDEADRIQDDPVEGPSIDDDCIADLGDGMPRLTPGLVAEDLVDAGLENFAQYDRDPDTGEDRLQGIAYDRLWTLLIPLVRDQRDRIGELETQLDNTNERLDALEAALRAQHEDDAL